MHIGPFYYFEQMPLIACCYRGTQQRPQVSTALTYSGDLQIELIQQRDQTATTYLEFLAAGHEGLHHIGFLAEHYDLNLQRAAEAGLLIEQSDVIGNPHGKSAYFASTGHAGAKLKLSALYPGNRDMYRMVKTEAERWDGSGPVRRIDL